MSKSYTSGGSEPKELSIDALASMREQADVLSAFMRERLLRQLEVLRPLFSPRRILGRHVRGAGREDVPGSERALSQLRERFAAACGRPFSLPKELEEGPLSGESVLELYPFVYPHSLEGDPERVISITDPVCWSVGYRSGYTLAELEGALANRSNLRVADARQFLLNGLVLELVLESIPKLSELLGDLRYTVEIEKRAHLGELPILTLRAPLPSFRPSDEVIATATRFSGVRAFIELIDVDALGSLRDPLREELGELLR